MKELIISLGKIRVRHKSFLAEPSVFRSTMRNILSTYIEMNWNQKIAKTFDSFWSRKCWRNPPTSGTRSSPAIRNNFGQPVMTISLLFFLLDKHIWPQNVRVFLWTTTLHVVGGYQLKEQQNTKERLKQLEQVPIPVYSKISWGNLPVFGAKISARQTQIHKKNTLLFFHEYQ